MDTFRLNVNGREVTVESEAERPLVDVLREDLGLTGAGETPIIAVAPAIANAVFHATGRRLRSMPL